MAKYNSASVQIKDPGTPVTEQTMACKFIVEAFERYKTRTKVSRASLPAEGSMCAHSDQRVIQSCERRQCGTSPPLSSQAVLRRLHSGRLPLRLKLALVAGHMMALTLQG